MKKEIIKEAIGGFVILIVIMSIIAGICKFGFFSKSEIKPKSTSSIECCICGKNLLNENYYYNLFEIKIGGHFYTFCRECYTENEGTFNYHKKRIEEIIEEQSRPYKIKELENTIKKLTDELK